MISVLLELGEKYYERKEVRMAHCDWKSENGFPTGDVMFSQGLNVSGIFQANHDFKDISDKQSNGYREIRKLQKIHYDERIGNWRGNETKE